MIILSNCLTPVTDEGCLNVANSIVKRIKAEDPSVTVLSYERRSPLTDYDLKLNKFLLNKSLLSLLRKRKEALLYIPFPAKSISTAIRTFVLSLLSGGRVNVLLTMTGNYGVTARLLMKLSRARIFALSEESAAYYAGIVGEDKAICLKTGVDTNRFVPVNAEKAAELKKAYGFAPDRKVILHVGHLKEGRNLAHLRKLSSEYQIVLVVSTLTQKDQDESLRRKLQECSNIRIIEEYLPRIQEIYQLSDVYFFPVESRSHCIDVPLSALEAASCGKPVVTTDFGEMKAFSGEAGFFFLNSFEENHMNALINEALQCEKDHIRDAVLAYDWSHAVSLLLGLDQER